MVGKRKNLFIAVGLIVVGLLVTGIWKIGQIDSAERDREELGNTDIEMVDMDVEAVDSESALRAMVYMENNGAGGNGSIYKITKDEVIIVTTYHLLQNGETISIRFHDNMYVEGSVSGVNEEHDVGFVKIPLEEVPSETAKRIGAIQRNADLYDSLAQGDYVEYLFLSYDGVFVCQESHKGAIGDMNWYVEDFNDELIYNYCEVQPGMSGCAAIAEDGSYIGMVIGGYENESAALSIRVIDKVYQELEDFTKS